MGLRDQVRRWWAKRALTLNDPALRGLWQDLQTHSGVSVTEYTALNLAAVWAAVRVISEDVATLPLFLYRRLEGGGKERAPDRKLYHLLHDEPNPEMSAVSFRETLQAHVLTWGNAYAEIERNGLNEPVALWPLPPNRVVPERVKVGGRLIYRFRKDDGRDVILTPNDVFHLPGLGFNGIVGYSVISKARESLGVTAAAERFSASFFGKGGRPGVVLEHPKALSDQAREHLRNSWKALFGGPEKSNELAILEEGMKLHDFGIPQKDMQYLEQRKFGVTEVARWFRVPPHKIMDLERATFSNIESQAIDYVVSTLRPWLVRWEQECTRKLIPSLERNKFFFEHLVDGLLRGDAASRAQALQTQFQNGALNPDEWREIENRNPLPGGLGKTYFVQGAMQTIEEAKKPKPDPVLRPLTPSQTEPEPDDEEDEDDRALALVREAISSLDALAAEVRAMKPPVVNVAPSVPTVNVAPAEIHVEPTPVTVEAPVHVDVYVPPIGPKPVRAEELSAAHRGLLVAAIGRLVRREAKAIRKRLLRVKGPDEFMVWAADYYRAHVPLVAATVQSTVTAEQYCNEALAGVKAAVAGPADTFAQRVEDLMSRWERARPEEVAAEVMLSRGG